MEDKKKDSQQVNSIDLQMKAMGDCSDEELLKEFYAASQLEDGVIPHAPEGEADIIWERIQSENINGKTKEKPEKEVRRLSWKRVTAIGLIACMLAFGCCFAAMGTKSYFMREKMMGNTPVLVNDTYKIDVNGENEAYEKIESELGIRPMKLAYMLDSMEFNALTIEEGHAVMLFNYNNEVIAFTQAKYPEAVSYNHKSESKKNKTVYNKWLGKNLIIKQEVLSDEKIAYEMSAVLEGGYYVFSGIMEEDEFIKIIERLSF